MSHLTPEILRAAALRLWDGESQLRPDQAIGIGEAVRRIDPGFDDHGFFEILLEADPCCTFSFDELGSLTACQAARFDFLNLLACSLES